MAKKEGEQDGAGYYHRRKTDGYQVGGRGAYAGAGDRPRRLPYEPGAGPGGGSAGSFTGGPGGGPGGGSAAAERPGDVLGFIPAEGGITVPLSDSDGDGVYTGSTTLDRFGPGPRPVPPGTESVSLPVQIVQESSGTIEIIRDFGVVPLNGDRTFSARVNFKRDGRDTETPEVTAPGTPDGGSEGGGSQDSGSGASGEAPDLTAPENGVDLNQDGSADEADGQVAAATSDAAMEAHQASGGNALPATGGATILQIAGSAGALLVAGGLLIRSLIR
jgi:hypothetical protein